MTTMRVLGASSPTEDGTATYITTVTSDDTEAVDAITTAYLVVARGTAGADPIHAKMLNFDSVTRALFKPWTEDIVTQQLQLPKQEVLTFDASATVAAVSMARTSGCAFALKHLVKDTTLPMVINDQDLCASACLAFVKEKGASKTTGECTMVPVIVSKHDDSAYYFLSDDAIAKKEAQDIEKATELGTIVLPRMFPTQILPVSRRKTPQEAAVDLMINKFVKVPTLLRIRSEEPIYMLDACVIDTVFSDPHAKWLNEAIDGDDVSCCALASFDRAELGIIAQVMYDGSGKKLAAAHPLAQKVQRIMDDDALVKRVLGSASAAPA